MNCGGAACGVDPQEVYRSDPSTGSGQVFPGETFRVLTKSRPWGKEKELKAPTAGTLRSRTRRLVLEKWDELKG